MSITACEGGDRAGDSGCLSQTGTILGELRTYDGEPYLQSTLVTITPVGSEGFDLSVPAGGAFEAELQPGAYSLSASSMDGCVSENEAAVTVVACGSHAVELLLDLCVGR